MILINQGRSKSLRFWLIVFLLPACSLSGQSPAQAFRLAGVKVTGLKRFETAQVVKASGLRTGQSITLQDVEETVRRLSQTGFFQSIKYRYSYNKGTMDLEFEVVEAAKFLPCIFDNFVWFTDNEVRDAIRARIPLFVDGLPHAGTALQDATQAVEGMLKARNIGGTVTFLLDQDRQQAQPFALLFRVSGVRLPIRRLEFPGARAVSESELQVKAKSLLGQQYSKTYLATFARQTLAQLFREKGNLRIQFKEPVLSVEAGPGSENAVSVVLPAVEGLAYSWNGAAWTGDSVLPAEDLDRMLGLKIGDVANGIRIDKGLGAIREHLGKNGYIEAQTGAVPDYNDADRMVSFEIQLASGPQYRMGSVEFKGVPEQAARELQSLWRLRPGQVFDLSYANEFLNKAAKSVIAAIRPKETSAMVNVDREKRLANVIFEFK